MKIYIRILKKKKNSIVSLILFFFVLEFILFPCWAQASDGTQPWNGTDPAQQTEGEGSDDGNEGRGDGPLDADPVEIATGNYTYQHQDISLPARGLDLAIIRNYNGRNFYTGPFGYGWEHNYTMHLNMICEIIQEDPLVTKDQAIIRKGDGRKEYFTKNPDGSFTSPAGCFASLTENLDNTYTYRKKYGTEYKLNADGFLVHIMDRNNNAISLNYDANQRLLEVIEPAGRKLFFEYNEDNKIDQISIITSQPTDTRITKYRYDQNDNLIEVIDPLNNSITYSYDESHNLLSITDAVENNRDTPTPYLVNTYDDEDRVVEQQYGEGIFRFQYYPAEKKTTVINRRGYRKTIYYNDNDRPITEVDHQGNTILKTWDAQMNMTSRTDARGNTTSYEYDSRGNTTKINYPIIDPDTTLPINQNMVYEETYNKITKIIDPYQRETNFEYDGQGNLTKVTDPTLHEKSMTYDTWGQLTSITDANLNKTTFGYDSYGNITQITREITANPENFITTSLDYDTLGNITKITDARGHITQFNYDAASRLIRTIDDLNNVVEYIRDEKGNIAQTLAKNSEGTILTTVDYEYDILDQVISITDAMDNITRYEYDNNGNKTKVIDANGNATAYIYDSLDRLISATDAEGNVTQYSYDENYNLKTLTDANYRTIFFAYDELDRLLQMKYPDMSTEKYTYDYYSNIASFTNRANETITYEYDILGRREKKIYPDSAAVTYTYDNGGRLIKINNSSGDTVYEYDEADRVTSVTYPDARIVSYTYDKNGNRTGLTYPGGVETLTYLYDSLNRVTQIKDSSNNIIVGYVYDDLSRRTETNLGNGTKATYEYDALSQLTSLINRVTSPDEIISSFAYSYDKVGNRKTMGTLSGTHNYEYDKIYQLMQSLTPAMQQTDYNYDSVGNRISKTSPPETLSYTINWLNQYTQVGAANVGYDQNGNLTNDGTNSYVYTCENRLKEAVTTGDTITYDYDALGRRIKKTSSSEIRHYVYDGAQVIMELDDTGTEIARFVYGPGIDEPIMITKSTGTYYYHTDGLGSVSEITDSSGNIVESYSYDVYGKAVIRNSDAQVITESSIGNPYMFTGRRYDKETDLYYYRARHYSATLGRFLQTDPIGFAAGDINLYRYVNNNPVNFVDPWGLSTLVYDRSEGTITLRDSAGNEVGSWPAANNPTSGTSQWPTGTYDFSWHAPHTDQGPDDTFGSHGNFIFDVPGRPGMGVHSGQENVADGLGRTGPEHATAGCIRTTDTATQQIGQTHATDPLTQITVQD